MPQCQDCVVHGGCPVNMHVFAPFLGCCRFACLQSLDLSGIPMLQDSQLHGLSRLHLQSVSLLGCEHITGAGLHHVALVPGLRALDLTGCCKVEGSCQWPCHVFFAASHNIAQLLHLRRWQSVPSCFSRCCACVLKLVRQHSHVPGIPTPAAALFPSPLPSPSLLNPIPFTTRHIRKSPNGVSSLCS